MPIQRYDREETAPPFAYYSDMDLVPQNGDWGDWVKYDDHVAIVKELEEKIKQLENKVA